MWAGKTRMLRYRYRFRYRFWWIGENHIKDGNQIKLMNRRKSYKRWKSNKVMNRRNSPPHCCCWESYKVMKYFCVKVWCDYTTTTMENSCHSPLSAVLRNLQPDAATIAAAKEAYFRRTARNLLCSVDALQLCARVISVRWSPTCQYWKTLYRWVRLE